MLMETASTSGREGLQQVFLGWARKEWGVCNFVDCLTYLENEGSNSHSSI